MPVPKQTVHGKLRYALETLSYAGVDLAYARALLKEPRNAINRGHLSSIISDLVKLEESIKELLHMVPNDKP